MGRDKWHKKEIWDCLYVLLKKKLGHSMVQQDAGIMQLSFHEKNEDWSSTTMIRHGDSVIKSLIHNEKMLSTDRFFSWSNTWT